MFMEIFLIYLMLGAIVGVVAGLLGVGGGLIIVPVLIMIFQYQDISSDILVHLAIGTSLATIMITSLSSIWAHHQHGAVLWPVFLKLVPGIIIGAWIGAYIAQQLQTDMLRIVFGVFEFYVAVQMSLNIKPKPHRVLPKTGGMFISGNVIGGVSSIVGIGGGSLTVPFLVWCNINMRQAVATSAACGLPIAVAGSIGFAVTGWSESNLPEHTSGYIYWPAFLGIVLTSVLFAPLGAKWAHQLPVAKLKMIFALLLFVLAAKMFLG